MLTISAAAQELALERPAVDVETDRAQQIALRHRGDGTGDFRGRPEQIVDQRIDRGFHLTPGAIGQPEADTLAGPAFTAHHLTNPFELLGHALVGSDDLVKGVGDLAHDADAVAGHAHREITDPHGLEGMKQFGEAVGVAVEAEVCVALRQGGGGRRAVGVGRCDDFIGGLHSYLQTPSWGAHGQ